MESKHQKHPAANTTVRHLPLGALKSSAGREFSVIVSATGAPAVEFLQVSSEDFISGDMQTCRGSIRSHRRVRVRMGL